MSIKNPLAPEPSAEQSAFLDALGGPKAIATDLNARLNLVNTEYEMTNQTVSNWKSRGIPYRWRGPLVMMAQEKGVAQPPDFFGIGASQAEQSTA